MMYDYKLLESVVCWIFYEIIFFITKLPGIASSPVRFDLAKNLLIIPLATFCLPKMEQRGRITCWLA